MAGIKAGKAIIELGLATQNFERGLGQIRASLGRVQSDFNKFARGFFALGAAGAGALVFPVKMATSLELARAEMEAFIGSAEKAASVVSDLEQFSLRFALDPAAITSAVNKLISYNVEVDRAVDLTKALAATTGGNAENMKSAALALGQVAGQGRLMGQEARQLIEANAKLWPSLADATGKSVGELREIMEKANKEEKKRKEDMKKGIKEVGDANQGLVLTFDVVADAMIAATQEGGRYGMVLSKMGNTVERQMKALAQATMLAVRPLGQALMPALREVVSRMRDFVRWAAPLISANRMIVFSFLELIKNLFLTALAFKAAAMAIPVINLALGGLEIAIGAIFNPLKTLQENIGFFVAAAVAGFLAFTDEGKEMAQTFIGWVRRMYAEFMDVYKGIYNALMSGNFEAAFAIATAAAEVVWLTFLDTLLIQWGDTWANVISIGRDSMTILGDLFGGLLRVLEGVLIVLKPVVKLLGTMWDLLDAVANSLAFLFQAYKAAQYLDFEGAGRILDEGNARVEKILERMSERWVPDEQQERERSMAVEAARARLDAMLAGQGVQGRTMAAARARAAAVDPKVQAEQLDELEEQTRLLRNLAPAGISIQ